MTPQIIWICLFLLNLVILGNRHGKEKKGIYNSYYDFIGLILSIYLLYSGGFFDPLFLHQ